MKWAALVSCLYCISLHKAAVLDLKKLKTQILEAAQGERNEQSATKISQNTRIIGGIQSARGEAPWQASLRLSVLSLDYHLHYCGAVIINDYWLVSAAHCLNISLELDLPPDIEIDVTVAIGEYDMTVKDPYEHMRLIRSISVHPEFDKTGNIENDIGLILMTEPIITGRYVYPVLLPSAAETFPDAVCTVSGWGTTTVDEYDTMASVLQKTTVEVVADSTCEESCSIYQCIIFESMICAGVTAGGKDACLGDSGGALTCVGTDGYLYLAGIVSGGYGCAQPGLYGIYTEVSYFRQWINATMEEGMVWSAETHITAENTSQTSSSTEWQETITLAQSGTVDPGLLSDSNPKKLTLATTTSDPSQGAVTSSKVAYILLFIVLLLLAVF